MIEINLFIMVAQVLTFFVALSIIWKFAWKPIIKVMNDRRSAIQKNLSDAEAAKQTVRQLEEDYRFRMKQLTEQSNQMISLATLQAGQIKNEMLAQARKEIDQIKQKNAELLDFERQTLVQQLRPEVINLAVAVAEKVLKKSIDRGTEQKKFADMLAGIEAGAAKDHSL